MAINRAVQAKGDSRMRAKYDWDIYNIQQVFALYQDAHMHASAMPPAILLLPPLVNLIFVS